MPSRILKSETRVAARMARRETKIIDRFQRAYTKRLLDLLPGDFDATMRSEVEALLPIRDRVAHRYLFEELDEWAARFRAGFEKLHDAANARLAELPGGEAPPELREAIERNVRAILLGERTKPG